MKGIRFRAAVFALQLLMLALPTAVFGAEFDREAVWPLCGRITENPPDGWAEDDDCPPVRFGRAAHTDEPFSSTLGPRPLYSENNRYDFHRGLDIATPIGTPFFAVASGVVLIAGDDPSYSDPLVSVRHYRPGA